MIAGHFSIHNMQEEEEKKLGRIIMLDRPAFFSAKVSNKQRTKKMWK